MYFGSCPIDSFFFNQSVQGTYSLERYQGIIKVTAAQTRPSRTRIQPFKPPAASPPLKLNKGPNLQRTNKRPIYTTWASLCWARPPPSFPPSLVPILLSLTQTSYPDNPSQRSLDWKISIPSYELLVLIIILLLYLIPFCIFILDWIIILFPNINIHTLFIRYPISVVINCPSSDGTCSGDLPALTAPAIVRLIDRPESLGLNLDSALFLGTHFEAPQSSRKLQTANCIKE